ncbi:BolA family protein [Undibacterium sp. SXout7W]|uniref:BolA family protein n=1 Tax=Undibacterium sp. SXout7W TaxID=3413049 RepID=UPI003BF36CA2
MSNPNRYDKIITRLKETFDPVVCQLTDDSASHAGHAGASTGAGHYILKIVCQQFEGLNRISRHRLVYDSVGDMMHTEIHALSIIALSPSEIPT